MIKRPRLFAACILVASLSIHLYADLALNSIVAAGTGIATWLGTPSSANLATALTDETGSGKVVFDTNPTISGCVGCSPMTLLVASSGSTSSTSAENLSTVALSGLTAKDTILVYYSSTAVTQNAGAVELYNSTDSVVLADLGNPASGDSRKGQAQLHQAQVGSTTVDSSSQRVGSGGISGVTAQVSVTTAYTGSWTLALRQEGVVSGGTLRWWWAAYKIAGQ